jgi:preprotein translocase subunit SecA
MANVLTKIFGSRNERLLKQYSRVVARINALESEIAALSDESLRAKTDEFRKRLSELVAAASEDTRETAEREAMDALLPEAFAVVREASRRTLEHAALRRAADRRHGAAQRQDRGDEAPARARRWWRRCRPT